MPESRHGRFGKIPLDLTEEGGEILAAAEVHTILDHGEPTVPILEFKVGLWQPAADPGAAIQPARHLI